jgi:hypothetical protein
MNTRELVETQSVSEETKGSDRDPRTENVKLVEMGQVSVETKGTSRGVELGFTPKNY